MGLFLDSIVKAGTVGLLAKSAVSLLNTIPNVAGAVVNAAVAGCVVAAIGEGSIYAFEQVYLGNKSVEDIDWVTKFMESKIASGFVEKVKLVLSKLGDNPDKDEILRAIKDAFFSASQGSTKKTAK